MGDHRHALAGIALRLTHGILNFWPLASGGTPQPAKFSADRLRMLRCLLRRPYTGQVSTEQAVKSLGIHRDKPRTMIPAVRHERSLAAGIAASLGHRGGKVQMLDELDLEMRPRQSVANHIRRIWTARKLLAAPGGVTVGAQLIAPLALTALAFVA